MIKKDFVSNMKLLSYNHSVMKTFGLFFVILAFSKTSFYISSNSCNYNFLAVLAAS
jgi:hypothetical protein